MIKQAQMQESSYVARPIIFTIHIYNVNERVVMDKDALCDVTVTVMPFGEIVCGSPGSGKSTYCHGKYQLFTALKRNISVVNLDPANESIPYPCAIDISSLITLQDAMTEHGLGPNGAMLYCMEYLEANFDWLQARLEELGKDAYVLFDLPGQVELSTSHFSVKNIVETLQKTGFRVSFLLVWLTTHSEIARRSPPLRCTLRDRCVKVHLGTASIAQSYAASGTAPHKCALQG